MNVLKFVFRLNKFKLLRRQIMLKCFCFYAVQASFVCTVLMIGQVIANADNIRTTDTPLYNHEYVTAIGQFSQESEHETGSSVCQMAEEVTQERIMWWPTSGSVLSVCYASGCVGSVCFASGCVGSVCFGSGCGASACAISGCGVSLCNASVCLGSVCYGSGCLGTICLGSACVNSECAGSACVVSVCIGSACEASACINSNCTLSGCYESACGTSGCSTSGCAGSACAYSGCVVPDCAGAHYNYSTQEQILLASISNQILQIAVSRAGKYTIVYKDNTGNERKYITTLKSNRVCNLSLHSIQELISVQISSTT
jgi:hypothetical protein